MEMEDLSEIQDEFLIEASELLNSTEESFLAIEQDPQNKLEIQKIARLYHNFKGAGASVEFHSLSKFCHKVENLLSMALDDELILEAFHVDFLLKANDCLKNFVIILKQNKQGTLDTSQIEKQIEEFIELEKNKNELKANSEQSKLDISLKEFKIPTDQNISIDTNLFKEFLIDACDNLETLESNMTILEKDRNSTEALNSLFRAFHTLKGASGIIGFSPLENLTHIMETLLDKIRKGEIPFSNIHYQTCDESIGLIREMIQFINDGGDLKLLFQEVENFDQVHQKLLYTNNQNKRGSSNESPDSSESSNASNVATTQNASDASKASEITQEINLIGVDPAQMQNKSSSTNLNSSNSSGTKAAGSDQRPVLTIVSELDEAAATSAAGGRDGGSGGPAGSGIGEGGAGPTGGGNTPLKEGIKVDTDRLERLIDMIGELVISEAMVSQSEELKIYTPSDKIFKHLSQLNKITRGLQEIGMSLRLIPIRGAFRKMHRIVRDVSRKLNKQVSLELIGEDTELDKNVIDKISDPLVHMVRNSLDHGIEKTAEERKKGGKLAEGKIFLRAFHRGGNVWIEIEDDGRGLNKEVLKNKAIEKKLIAPDAVLTDKEIYSLIFLPGFSTAEKVTDVSGRGVGMDVVRKNIEEIRGQIDIESQIGKGTRFTIKIPNTLAIIEGMVIMVGPERYVIPSLNVVKTIRLEQDEYFTVSGGKGEAFKVKNEIFPLVRLHDLFKVEGAKTNPHEALVLIAEEEGSRVGFLIDRILKQQQFVIKNLGDYVKNTPGISGGTIMPDGGVGLFLDVGAIIKIYQTQNKDHNTTKMKPKTKTMPQIQKTQTDSSSTQRLREKHG